MNENGFLFICKVTFNSRCHKVERKSGTRQSGTIQLYPGFKIWLCRKLTLLWWPPTPRLPPRKTRTLSQCIFGLTNTKIRSRSIYCPKTNAIFYKDQTRQPFFGLFPSQVTIAMAAYYSTYTTKERFTYFTTSTPSNLIATIFLVPYPPKVQFSPLTQYAHDCSRQNY